MKMSELNEAKYSLADKKANQPCPRCSSNSFSIVGESEITVIRAHSRAQNALAGLGLARVKTTMPIIVITCDNCGYVIQHAKAALIKTDNKFPPAGGLNALARNYGGNDE